jgi:hypothetical protein
MALQMVHLFLLCSVRPYGFFAALLGNLLSILFCFRGAWP